MSFLDKVIIFLDHIDVFLVSGFVFLFFIIYPIRNKLRFGVKTTAFFTAIYVLLSWLSIIQYFSWEDVYHAFDLIPFLIWTTFGFLFFVLILKCNLYQLVFVYFIKLSIHCSVQYLCQVLVNMLDGFPLDHFTLASHLSALIYAPVFWYLIKVLFVKLLDIDEDYAHWGKLSCIPLMFFLYINIGAVNHKDYAGENYFVDILLFIFLTGVMVMIYSIAMKMLIKTHDSMKEREKFNMMCNQLKIQKESYEKLSQNLQETAKLRHDWRHQLLLIKNYAEQGELNKLNEYLSGYVSNMESTEIPLCANPLVDMVLRYYISLANKRGIQTYVHVALPDVLKISDSDLCILFGNAIQNAVDACLMQEEGTTRFLRVRVHTNGGQLFILIENSFSPKTLNKRGEVFATTKENGSGIGIPSIRNIVNSNGGELRFSWEENVFNVYIMLNI